MLTNLTKTIARGAAAAAIAALCSAPLVAQATPPKPMDKMDHSKMEQDHGKSAWKELDAYHEFMMATWHPAKGKNDMAPLKAKAVDMAKAAKVWADSKAPKGCDTAPLKEAVANVNTGTHELAALVAKSADDATLKAKLSGLHDTFEIVEEGCKPAK